MAPNNSSEKDLFSNRGNAIAAVVAAVAALFSAGVGFVAKAGVAEVSDNQNRLDENQRLTNLYDLCMTGMEPVSGVPIPLSDNATWEKYIGCLKTRNSAYALGKVFVPNQDIALCAAEVGRLRNMSGRAAKTFQCVDAVPK